MHASSQEEERSLRLEYLQTTQKEQRIRNLKVQMIVFLKMETSERMKKPPQLTNFDLPEELD